MSFVEVFLNLIVFFVMNVIEGCSLVDSSIKNVRILDKDVGFFLGNGNVMFYYGIDYIIF